MRPSPRGSTSRIHLSRGCLSAAPFPMMTTSPKLMRTRQAPRDVTRPRAPRAPGRAAPRHNALLTSLSLAVSLLAVELIVPLDNRCPRICFFRCGHGADGPGRYRRTVAPNSQQPRKVLPMATGERRWCRHSLKPTTTTPGARGITQRRRQRHPPFNSNAVRVNASMGWILPPTRPLVSGANPSKRERGPGLPGISGAPATARRRVPRTGRASATSPRSFSSAMHSLRRREQSDETRPRPPVPTTRAATTAGSERKAAGAAARSRSRSRAGPTTSRLACSSGFPDSTGCVSNGDAAPETAQDSGAPAAQPRRAPGPPRTRTASETQFFAGGGVPPGAARSPGCQWQCPCCNPPAGVDWRESARAAQAGSAAASATTTGAPSRPAAAQAPEDVRSPTTTRTRAPVPWRGDPGPHHECHGLRRAYQPGAYVRLGGASSAAPSRSATAGSPGCQGKYLGCDDPCAKMRADPGKARTRWLSSLSLVRITEARRLIPASSRC
jgi:hypothetical protein